MEELRKLAELHIQSDIEEKLRLRGVHEHAVLSLQQAALSSLFDQRYADDDACTVDSVTEEIRAICTIWRQLGHFDRGNKLDALLAIFNCQCSAGTRKTSKFHTTFRTGT